MTARVRIMREEQWKDDINEPCYVEFDRVPMIGERVMLYGDRLGDYWVTIVEHGKGAFDGAAAVLWVRKIEDEEDMDAELWWYFCAQKCREAWQLGHPPQLAWSGGASWVLRRLPRIFEGLGKGGPADRSIHRTIAARRGSHRRTHKR